MTIKEKRDTWRNNKRANVFAKLLVKSVIELNTKDYKSTLAEELEDIYSIMSEQDVTNTINCLAIQKKEIQDEYNCSHRISKYENAYEIAEMFLNEKLKDHCL